MCRQMNFGSSGDTDKRIEQYQDTIMMLGHSGYLETVRRALHYTLRRNSIDAAPDTVEAFMRGWQHLSPFPEVLVCPREAAISLSVGGAIQRGCRVFTIPGRRAGCLGV